MKKSIAMLIVSAFLVASLTGCGEEAEITQGNSSQESSSQVNSDSTEQQSSSSSKESGSSGSSKESGSSSESAPEEIKYSATEEIMNADFNSGLVQVDNEVFRQGGYITVAELVEQVMDSYDISYMDGTYEERKDYLLEYQEYNEKLIADDSSYRSVSYRNELYEGEYNLKGLYRLELTPKTGNNQNLRKIEAVVGNFTSPDEKITLDKAIVVGYTIMNVSSRSGGLADTHASVWTPKGFGLPTEITSSFNATPHKSQNIPPEDMVSVNDNYSPKSLSEYFDSLGCSGFSDQDWYKNCDMGNPDSYDNTYIQGDNYLKLFCVGETNLFGARPVYRYTFDFDGNTDKICAVSYHFMGFVKDPQE